MYCNPLDAQHPPAVGSDYRRPRDAVQIAFDITAVKSGTYFTDRWKQVDYVENCPPAADKRNARLRAPRPASGWYMGNTAPYQGHAEQRNTARAAI